MALVTDGKPMTDEEALQTLQSLKLIDSRGSSKTVFDGIVFEALSHAYEALKEKVNNTRSDK